MAADNITGPEEPNLLMRVLDGFSLEDASGQRVAIANRKACGLLAYLTLSQTSFEARERLTGLLWSGRGEEHARASLRQCLKQLRTLFEDIAFSGFTTDRHAISLKKGSIEVDLHTIAAELSQGRIPSNLVEGTALTDRILYGLETLDPSFTAWLHVLRQSWYDRLVEALQAVLRSDKFHVDTIRHAAEALVNVDPTHEEAQRYLIEHHASQGNVAAALRQYKSLWDLLDDEYDMEPADETLALIADIKAGTYQPSEKTATLAVVEPVAGLTEPARLPIICVRHYIKGGPWKQENYLIEGFRRELIASLVRFRDWVVVEGQRPADFSTPDPLIAEKAEVSADYVIEGVYLEEAGTIRLIITLKERASQKYIWSEQLALTLEGWFEAQREIVRRISVSLNVYLSVERLTRVAGRPDVSLAIYDRWLRGQDLSFRWRPEGCVRASNIFRSIIQEAPDFAPAYSSLVQIENSRQLISPGVFRLPQREAETLSLAKTAVEIDPLDSRTQLCLAWSHAMNGQFDQAEFFYRLALKLNENDSWTMVSSALGLAYSGQTTEAGELADQALRLDLTPSPSHWGYQAGIRFLCRDYAACVDAAIRAGNTIYYLPAWKAAALSLLGRAREAKVEAHSFLDLVRSNWHGTEDPDDEAIAHWLLHSFPIRQEAARERLRSGVNAAGIPAPE